MARLKCKTRKNNFLLAVAAIVVYTTTAFAQSTKDACGPTPVIPLTGEEPPAKIVVYPPLAEPLASRGVAIIQYCAQNLHLVPVFGPNKRNLGRRDPPRICATTGRYCRHGALVFERLANTDLGLQLKKHGIEKLIVMGLIAHTCVEATVRYAAELGYEVTMVKDATADYSDDEMHAALEVNIPNYATAIVTTNEVVDSISFL